MNLNSEEKIKTFLKLDSPKYEDKPYYSINKSKNTITLFDKIIKSPSDNSAEFEEDKIFTESDENSYIYEEICLNTIKDALNGISYSFIFYGDTSSSKYNLSIGEINQDKSNYNKYGIYLRFIDNIIKETNNNKNINLKLSYFILHDSDIIDLSNLKGKTIDINNFSINDLNKFKNPIKIEENILNQIIQLNLEKMTKELNFLSNVLNLLFNLESNENNNILSRSHFCINLYINHEKSKKNSVINFLILNGSEYLYYGLNNKFKLKANKVNKKQGGKIYHDNFVQGSIISLETQYTYETLLNLVKLNLDINKGGIKYNPNKKEQNSKLTNILYNLYQNISKIKFRIICTITPSTGQYHNFKDALLFLQDFNKLKKTYKKKETKKINQDKDGIIKTLTEKDKDKLIKRVIEQNEDIEKRDNKIFILENDIINYKKEIKEINKELNQRNEKINFLEKAYMEQINTLKDKLDFHGDVNVLISGDENSDELKYVKKLKDIIELNKKNENVINNLKEKLNKKNEEIKQIKNEMDLLKNNQTMLNYYLSVKNNQKYHLDQKEKNEEKNHFLTDIENLNKEIALKNKLIEKYKQEIENKNKILLNLPRTLKDVYTPTMPLNSKKTNKQMDDHDHKDDLDIDSIYKSEINNIKKESNENIKNIKSNCDKIIKQKNEDLKKMHYEYDKINIERNNDINKYTNEIVRMNKLLMKLLSNYKRIFFSNLSPKINLMNYTNKIDEFDKIINSINQEITYDKFPLLFEHLTKNKQFDINQPFLHYNIKKVYTPIMNDLDEKNNIKKIDTIKKEEKKVNDNIILNKEKLELMSKESLIKYILNINYKLKKQKSKKNLEDIDIDINTENKDEIIVELKKRLNYLGGQLEEQIKRNNSNEVVIGAQNRRIDRLQKESFLLKHNLRNEKSSSLLTPNRSTIYNSSAIDIHTNFSENVTSIKNNNVKSMKKSSSYLSINKLKYKRPLSHKLRKFPENNLNKINTTNKVLSREISSKLREFQLDRENNIINSCQNKK